MIVSESYTELVNQVYSQAGQEGTRPYPVNCCEIYMLTLAQNRAKQKEAAVFKQLTEIFDWNLTPRQRSGYARELLSGATLVLTDLTKTILWTSHSFLTMTGYTTAETLGQSPAMLHGPGTDPLTLRRIRESLQSADAVRTDVLNYRKNGEPYLCRVAIDPVYNSQHELTHFLAVENAVL